MKLLPTPHGEKLILMYDIIVRDDGKDVVYRTKKLLNDVGARCIRGRGTRVWEAVKLKNGAEDGDLVALKDSWVDANRQREFEILKKLKNADASTDFQKAIVDILLTIDCSSDVLVVGKPDHTRDLHTDGHKPPTSRAPYALVLQTFPQEASTPSVQGERSVRVPLSCLQQLEERTPVLAPPTHNPTFHEKQHHRSVFHQVGTSLYEQNEAHVVFHVLAFVTSGQWCIIGSPLRTLTQTY